jgi:dTDP-4-dehydrorhamnose 3,5-epimerase
MGKLVRCTVGEIQDVVVDLRAGAPTFGRWLDFDLTAANKRQLWVPPGFGHAFAVLSEVAEVQYKCTGYYTPEAEGTLAWNDPEVGIRWRVADPQVSGRDAAGITLAEYRRRPDFTYSA